MRKAMDAELERAAQARAEAERVERDKPALVDVYIQQPRRDMVVFPFDDVGTKKVPWPEVLVSERLS